VAEKNVSIQIEIQIQIQIDFLIDCLSSTLPLPSPRDTRHAPLAPQYPPLLPDFLSTRPQVML